MWRGTQPLGSTEEPHGSHQEGRITCVLVDFITTIDAHRDLTSNCSVQIARKVGCWRSDEDEMLTCLKMSDPSGLTMAGKIDVLLLLGKGQSRSNTETKSHHQTLLLGALSTLDHRPEASQTQT